MHMHFNLYRIAQVTRICGSLIGDNFDCNCAISAISLIHNSAAWVYVHIRTKGCSDLDL